MSPTKTLFTLGSELINLKFKIDSEQYFSKKDREVVHEILEIIEQIRLTLKVPEDEENRRADFQITLRSSYSEMLQVTNFLKEMQLEHHFEVG